VKIQSAWIDFKGEAENFWFQQKSGLESPVRFDLRDKGVGYSSSATTSTNSSAFRE
jgi:hypothetical protein